MKRSSPVIPTKLASAAVLLWALTQYAPAHGAETRIVKYNISEKSPFVVNVAVDRPAILSLPNVVSLVKTDQNPALLGLSFQQHSHEVKIQPRKGAESEHVKIFIDGHTVRVFLHIVEKEQAIDRAEFYDGHAYEQWLETECDTRLDATLSMLFFQGYAATKLRHETVQGNGALQIKRPQLRKLGDRHLLNLHIKNTTYPVLPIETLRLLDARSQNEHTRFIQFKFPEASRPSDAQIELAQGQAVEVNLSADSLEHLGHAAYLQVVSTGGIVLATERIFLDPPPPENKGRISIQAQAVGGAVGLQNEAADTEFTLLSGLGARASYGLLDYLTFEGTLSYVTSNEATFPDSSTAELASARLLGGLLVHTAGKYKAFARLGVGVRATRNTTATSTDSSTSTRASGLYNFGLGIDAGLTSWLVTGISANYVGGYAGDDTSYSFELGVHAGISWQIEEDW